ncbi:MULTISPECIES: hypothetical protein [unclassified Schlesneria]|uniref:hypothetical protein n=1 Tax=Schlesneria TaxID=656899 RepID=UPI00359F4ABF
MSAPNDERIITAIEAGSLEVHALPKLVPDTSAETEVFQIVLTLSGDEIARLGVWKTSSGGVFGDGAPRVNVMNKTIHVLAGDRMQGSFDIECELPTQAEEIAEALQEQLTNAYDEVEVEIVNS